MDVNTSSECKIKGFRATLPQIWAVSVKNVLLIGFGMALGFPTILIADLETLKEDQQETLQVTEDQLSWIGAINLIFVPLGCLSSGPLSQKFGRKRMMQVILIPQVLTWLLFRFAFHISMFYIGLAAFGILHGLIEAPVITYVAEVTTANLRGTLTSTSTLCTILGILLEFILGAVFYWRTVAQLSLTVPVLAFALLLFIPESPLWLAKRQKNAEAKEALIWLRGCRHRPELINAEYQKLILSLNINNNNQQQPKMEFGKTLRSRNFYMPYILVSSVFFLQSFSGMTNIQTYAAEIFEELKTPLNKYFASTLLGTVEFLGCLTCVCLIRKTGKRILAFTCMSISIVFLLITIAYCYTKVEKYSWIPLSSFLAFAFFAHAGIRVLPWVLVGEVFPNDIRPFASGLSAATGYVFGFAANKLFFLMKNTFTLPGLFIFYCAVTALGIIWLYLYLPETEGRTLDEICKFFADTGNANASRVTRNSGSLSLHQTLEDLYVSGVETAKATTNYYRKFSAVDSVL